MNITLAISFIFYNTNKCKKPQNLIIGVRWSMNEHVTVVIPLAQNPKSIIKMFVIHSFPFPKTKMPFCEVHNMCNMGYHLW